MGGKTTDREAAEFVPSAVRVEVPEDYGACYAGQYIERRVRIGRRVLRVLDGLKQFVADDEQFQTACEIFSALITDWNLKGEEGPLPKPWGNPQAFVELADSDIDLFIWLNNTIYRPVHLLSPPPKN